MCNFFHNRFSFPFFSCFANMLRACLVCLLGNLALSLLPGPNYCLWVNKPKLASAPPDPVSKRQTRLFSCPTIISIRMSHGHHYLTRSETEPRIFSSKFIFWFPPSQKMCPVAQVRHLGVILNTFFFVAPVSTNSMILLPKHPSISSTVTFTPAAIFLPKAPFAVAWGIAGVVLTTPASALFMLKFCPAELSNHSNLIMFHIPRLWQPEWYPKA